MALYQPDPGTAAAIIEELGRALAARFANAEQVMVEQAAKHAHKILALEQSVGDDTTDLVAQQRALQSLAVARAQALRELRELARTVTQDIADQRLSEWLVGIASTEGQSAAAARLQLARNLPAAAGFTGTAAQAVGSLMLDLSSKLAFLNARLTRYPDDIYKQVMSEHSPRVLLGAETPLVMQRKAVRDFLSRGITGFIDKAKRPWRIGTYAEMVGRTSAQRAWQDAGVWRMQQSGINLVTIVGGRDACARCAPWIGKILSTNGAAGPMLVPHASKDEMVGIFVDGTLEDARRAGWGHPNCRDQAVAFIPGLSSPEAVEYSPALEAERAEQRRIERDIRAAKRDASIAGDDVTRRRAEKEVREHQAEMREFLNKTGRLRNSAREQLHFADGRGTVPPRPNRAPSAPAAPRSGLDIRVPKGTALGDELRSARAAIAKVHTIPQGLPYAPVGSADPTAKHMGVYYPTRSELQIRGNGPTVQLTTAHEIGHYLDHRLLGNSGKSFETAHLTRPTTKAWLAEVQNTPEVRRLQEILAQADGPLEAHVAYLLSPEELWGRSYAQWVAVRSGQQQMLDGVNHWLDSAAPWTSSRQWGHTGFEPVAKAIDAIFRDKGLLK